LKAGGTVTLDRVRRRIAGCHVNLRLALAALGGRETAAGRLQ